MEPSTERSDARICVYCAQPAEDLDHVPPRCFFPRPLPGDLVKVPSCRRCNRRFSRDDEYFRDSLALSTVDTPYPSELRTLHEAARRSLAHKEFRPPVREFVTTARSGWAPYRSQIAEPAKLFRIDMTRIACTVQRIVRGLHYHETARRLPASHEPQVILGKTLARANSLDRVFFERLFAPLHSAQWRSIGGRAFGYAFAPARMSDPDSRVWALSFYGRLTFLVFTDPEGQVVRTA